MKEIVELRLFMAPQKIRFYGDLYVTWNVDCSRIRNIIEYATPHALECVILGVDNLI